MFRVKQIGIVAILGLALVISTATVFATTQSAQAGFGRGFQGGLPGGSTGGQNSQGQNDNSQGNGATSTGGGVTGGNPPITCCRD